jgi:hypothetical protein
MREIAAYGKAAWESWPGQHPTMAGLAVGLDELNVLISAELFRLGGIPIATGGGAGSAVMALPPPRAPGIMFAGTPDMVEPLTTAIEKATAYGRAMLEH